MRQAILWFIRIAVSLAIAGSALYFLVLSPKQQALSTIDRQTDSVGAIIKAIDNGQAQLAAIPVTKIALQTNGSLRTYIRDVEAAVPVFNVARPEEAKPTIQLWQEKKIVDYNNIVKGKDYAPAVNQAMDAVNSAEGFIVYHRNVMLALGNLLEYNPAEDTNSDKAELVKSNLQAAATGIDKTLSRLKAAPRVKDDSLDIVISQVEDVQKARSIYAEAANENAIHGYERGAYITAILQAQKAILANRNNFWDANYPSIKLVLQKAKEKLNPFAAQLRNL